MGRQTLGQTSSRIGWRTNRQMDKDTAEIQTDGQTEEEQKDVWTNREMDRRTDGQTER